MAINKAKTHRNVSKRANIRAKRKRQEKIFRVERTEFFKGLSIDEILSRSDDENLQLIPSRARRTYQRGLNRDRFNLYTLLSNSGESDREIIKTHIRDLPILPSFVGKTVYIHNGKQFVKVEIEKNMIGDYLGDYALTRGRTVHTSKTRKKS